MPMKMLGSKHRCRSKGNACRAQLNSNEESPKNVGRSLEDIDREESHVFIFGATLDFKNWKREL